MSDDKENDEKSPADDTKEAPKTFAAQIEALQKHAGTPASATFDAITRMRNQTSNITDLYNPLTFPNLKSILKGFKETELEKRNRLLAEATGSAVSSLKSSFGDDVLKLKNSLKGFDDLAAQLNAQTTLKTPPLHAPNVVSAMRLPPSSPELKLLIAETQVVREAITSLLNHTVKFEEAKAKQATSQSFISLWGFIAAVASVVVGVGGILVSFFFSPSPVVNVPAPVVNVAPPAHDDKLTGELRKLVTELRRNSKESKQATAQ